MRKITSMTLLWSLIVLIFNSAVLYVVPEGRISNWAVWRFWGLDKHDWSAQHITVGVLFCVAGILHIFYNWKPILRYMENRAKNFRLITPASAIGLILSILFVVGTYMHVPPFSTIIEFSEQIKESGAQKYGDPPYSQAQSSSLKSFAARLGLDLDKSRELLAAAGIEISDDQEMIQTIAARHKMSPQEVYDIIKPARIQAEVEPEAGATPIALEATEEILVDAASAPNSGMGRKTIAQICEELGTDCGLMITDLAKMGINARAEIKVKDLASENGLEPMQLFEMMEEIVKGPAE
jgi:hypothetical protein